VECAKRQPGQPYDGAAPQELSRSAHTLELDLSAFQDDERISPLGFVERALAARREGDLPGLESGREASAEKGEALAFGVPLDRALRVVHLKSLRPRNFVIIYTF
jgi:hypothetical protein